MGVYLNSTRMGNLEGQGAIEYKLILAAILFIVAAAIGFLAATQPSALAVTGLAKNSGDNIVFTPAMAMVPPAIPAEDWEYAVYRDATKIFPPHIDWAPGTATLERGIPLQLLAVGNQVGDTLKIKYKGSTFDTFIGE